MFEQYKTHHTLNGDRIQSNDRLKAFGLYTVENVYFRYHLVSVTVPYNII